LGGHGRDVTGDVERFPRHSPARRIVGSSQRSRGSGLSGSRISAFRSHETYFRGHPRPIQIECKFYAAKYSLPRGPGGVPYQICGGAQTGHRVSKLDPERGIRWGEKYLYLSDGQFVDRSVITAELIVDDLLAYGISGCTGASSSASVRRNVETTERAFVVLLYLCDPKVIG
jgi:hypothetical protein